MDPFHKTVISIINPRKLKSMYIYNTILCIISPLHQITNKLVNANARVFNAASMGGTVNLTSLSLLTAVISLSQFFSFYWKSLKHYRGFAIWANGNGYSLCAPIMDFWKWSFMQVCNMNENILQGVKSERAPCIKLLSLKRKSRLWIIETSRF